MCHEPANARIRAARRAAASGRIEEELLVHGKPAIRPSVDGWARIYGYNTIWIDPEDDPYAHGFQVL